MSRYHDAITGYTIRLPTKVEEVPKIPDHLIDKIIGPGFYSRSSLVQNMIYRIFQMEARKVPAFNRSQLAKLSAVRALVATINTTRLYDGTILGGGVAPVVLAEGSNLNEQIPDFDVNRSGIFKPLWLPGPGAFAEPHFDDGSGELELAWLLRFRNGAHGMNAGLIFDKFKRFPNAPAYVLNYFKEEVAALAASI